MTNKTPTRSKMGKQHPPIGKSLHSPVFDFRAFFGFFDQ